MYSFQGRTFKAIVVSALGKLQETLCVGENRTSILIILPLFRSN